MSDKTVVIINEIEELNFKEKMDIFSYISTEVLGEILAKDIKTAIKEIKPEERLFFLGHVELLIQLATKTT